jgi:hypothetical protein
MYSSRHSSERLVWELNPSHSIDSGAATPVASRGSLFGVKFSKNGARLAHVFAHRSHVTAGLCFI